MEWGPVFHRGRLDGSARVLVLGQDPGAHECVARRALVGEAGQRVQGFLAKLGVESSYVMVNAFLYSAYGQGGAARHSDDPAIAAHRNRWLGALLDGSGVQAVVAFGGIATRSWEIWRDANPEAAARLTAVSVHHPTYPEGASRSGSKRKADAMREMLAGWNTAIAVLRPRIAPDVEGVPPPYGEKLTPADLAPIPERDLPPGLPPWMRALEAWATRLGETPDEKRATIVVRVPRKARTWPPGG